MSALTHIAGEVITVNGRYMRQRCSWCGAILLDYDLAGVAVAVSDDEPVTSGPPGDPVNWSHADLIPGHWPPGAMVRVDGPASFTVEHEDKDPLPEDSCMTLDPAVTA